jgi:hypothetical protein
MLIGILETRWLVKPTVARYVAAGIVGGVLTTLLVAATLHFIGRFGWGSAAALGSVPGFLLGFSFPFLLQKELEGDSPPRIANATPVQNSTRSRFDDPTTRLLCVVQVVLALMILAVPEGSVRLVLTALSLLAAAAIIRRLARDPKQRR